MHVCQVCVRDGVFAHVHVGGVHVSVFVDISREEGSFAVFTCVCTYGSLHGCLYEGRFVGIHGKYYCSEE